MNLKFIALIVKNQMLSECFIFLEKISIILAMICNSLITVRLIPGK
jgi:hypothetical protein